MALRRQAPAGRLRVNTASPFMLHVIVPLIGDFRARYPLIELELHSDDRIVDLLERRIDLAIRIGPLPDSSLHARPLCHTTRRVLASPAYLARHGTPQQVEDLAEHSLIGFTEPDRLNDWPLRHALGESWRINPALRASSGDTVRELALAGEGIASLSDFMTGRDRQRGELVEVLAAQRVDVRQPINAVYYRNTALASRITCFLDYLSERLGAGARTTEQGSRVRVSTAVAPVERQETALSIGHRWQGRFPGASAAPTIAPAGRRSVRSRRQSRGTPARSFRGR